MSEIPPLVIELQAKTAELHAALTQVENQLKQVAGTAEHAKEPVESFGSKLKELGKKAAEAFALKEVGEWILESGHAAAENASSFAIFSTAVKNVTGATDSQVEAINRQIEAMALATGHVAEDLHPAYEKLVAVTKDTSKSLALLSLAQDVAAVKHKDLATVAQAMSRAVSGNSAALAKIAPETKNATDAFAVLAKESKGAAASVADADPYMKLNAAMDQLKESVGVMVLPLIRALADALTQIVPKVQDFFAEMQKPTTDLGKGFAMTIEGVNAVGKSFVELFNSVGGGNAAIGDGFQFLGSVLDIYASKLRNVAYAMRDFGKGDFLGAAGNLDKTFGPSALGDTLDKLVHGYHTKFKGMDWSDMKLPDFSGLNTLGSNAGGVTGAGTGTDPVAAYITATGNQVQDALTKYQDNITKANQAFADAVSKQIQDFRTVFANATQANVATLFNQGFRSVDQLTAQLQQKLTQANNLAADATKLSAAGYSAEFIKQVMSEGAVAGDQMAQSLLAATPEQAKKLQDLYKQTNDAANTGVNDLSVQISDQFQTSTKALAKAMNQAAVTLKESLNKISRSVSQEGAKKGASNRLKPLMGEVAKDTAYANQQIINVNATSTTQASPAAVANAIVQSIKFNLPLTAAGN